MSEKFFSTSPYQTFTMLYALLLLFYYLPYVCLIWVFCCIAVLVNWVCPRLYIYIYIYGNHINLNLNSSYSNQWIKPWLKQRFDYCLFQVSFYNLHVYFWNNFLYTKFFLCYIKKYCYEKFYRKYNQ